MLAKIDACFTVTALMDLRPLWWLINLGDSLASVAVTVATFVWRLADYIIAER